MFRSGTGKSTLLKNLVSSIGGKKKIHLLNVSEAEKKIYTQLSGSKTSSLANFKELATTSKGSIILIEDLISIDKKEEVQLRQSLNYDAHHKRQKFFCVSHSIYKNSIWSLLSFFHFIIFTSSASNIPVLRFTLNYFKIEKTQLDSWLSKFREFGGRQGVYFYFDCLKMTFNLAENTNFTKLILLGTVGDSTNELKQTGLALTRDNLQLKFAQLVEAFEAKSQAEAVFCIVINCIPIHLIRERDLSFAFKSKNLGGPEVRFSLVDYITSLLSPNVSVPSPLKAFHSYVKSLCHVPQIFCLNKNF